MRVCARGRGIATVCLIHGRWHDGSCWDPLAERLRAAGHEVVAPDLPYEDPHTTYGQRIRPALEAVGDADGPIMVVGHSYGAGYAPLVADAVADATLVYVCPGRLGPFEGRKSPMRVVREGFRFPPDRSDGASVWDPDEAIRAIYPRLAPDVARLLASGLRPATAPTDSYPLKDQPAVPTGLVYARHDEFFNPDWSRWIAREILHVEPIELETGHFPMIEAPDALADALSAAVA
jgi:pimeloyl-ACP methyl ester carboxylesterase